MNRTLAAKVLRILTTALVVASVFAIVLPVGAATVGTGPVSTLVPFAAATAATLVVMLLLPGIDHLVGRVTGHWEVTPYSALSDAMTRTRAGSLEQALPGLAQVLAGGTGAARAMLWLAVDDRLVLAAQYPRPAAGSAAPGQADASGREMIAGLPSLLARSDAHHVVPVLDGAVLRAALAIDKPGESITAADRLLVRDVANGAALLLRGVALNAELAERVRRADDLAAQLRGSRQRLTRARDVERRRLLGELSHVTADRLAGLRTEITLATADLAKPSPTGAVAQESLARARGVLDDLLERFRVIARGVYPAVLRDHGPVAALDEVATDVPRPVRITGILRERLPWEIESGLYYVAAAALQELGTGSPATELAVAVTREVDRVVVSVEDPAPSVTVERLREALADDAERLAALGGDIELIGGTDGTGPVRIRAWLPVRLEPVVDGSVGAELRVP